MTSIQELHVAISNDCAGLTTMTAELTKLRERIARIGVQAASTLKGTARLKAESAVGRITLAVSDLDDVIALLGAAVDSGQSYIGTT